MSYHFIFPVGDYSHDGHDFCADFLVKSECSLTEIRKTHLLFNHFIGSICSEYLENYISFKKLFTGCLEKPNSTKEEVIHFLFHFFAHHKVQDENDYFNDSIPLTLADFFKKEGLTNHSANELESFFSDEDNELGFYIENAEQMIEVWVQILNWFNPLLKLSVVSHGLSGYEIKYKGYPIQPDGNISSYFPKDKDTCHLNYPGYGVWSDSSNDEFCAHSN